MANFFDQFDNDPPAAPAPYVGPRLQLSQPISAPVDLELEDPPSDFKVLPGWDDSPAAATPSAAPVVASADPQPAGNFFDQFDEPKPKKTTKKQTQKKNFFDQFDADPPAAPEAPPSFLQSLDAAVGQFIPPEARQASDEQTKYRLAPMGMGPPSPPQYRTRSAASDINAMISGAAGLVDAGINTATHSLSPELIQAKTGIPAPLTKMLFPNFAPPVSRMQEHWESMPQIKQERDAAPATFDLIKGMTPNFAPIPTGLPILTGAGIAKSLVNTAITQGSVQALQKQGEQIKTRKYNQGDVLGAGLGGAIGGAAVHAGLAGIANTPGLVRNAIKAVAKKQMAPGEVAQKAAQTAVTNNLSKDQFHLTFGPYEKLSPETKSWYDAFYGEPEVIGPQISPMQRHAQEVEGELIEPDWVPGKPTNQYVDERPLSADEQAWYDHSKAITHEQRMEQMRNELSALREKLDGGKAEKPDDATGNARGKVEIKPAKEASPAAGTPPQTTNKESMNTGGKVTPVSATPEPVTMKVDGVDINANEFGAVQKKFLPDIKKWTNELNALIKNPNTPFADDRRFFLNNAIADATAAFEKSVRDLVETSKPVPPRMVSLNGNEPILLDTDSSTEGFIAAVQNAKDFDSSLAAVQAWADRLAGRPVDLAEKIEGDTRQILENQYHGRNKNQLAEPIDAHPVYDKPEVRPYLERLAAGKAQLDYDNEVLHKFSNDAWARFGDPNSTVYKFPNGVELRAKEERPKMLLEHQNQLDSVKAELPGDMKPVKRQVLEGLLTQKFGKGSANAHVNYIKVPSDENEAGEILKNLKDNVLSSEKAYKANKSNEAHFALAKAEKEVQELKKDKTVGVHVTVKTPHPLGDKYAPVEVGLQYKKGALEKHLWASSQKTFDEVKEVIEGKEANRTARQVISANIRGYKKTKALALAALYGVMDTMKADAATIGQRVNESLSFSDLWNTVPLNEAALGWIAVHQVMPALAKALMADEGLLAKAGIIWKDTMDHVSFSDRLHRRVYDAIGLDTPTNLQTKMMEISGQTQQASLGVHFNENLKSQGLKELRSGEITAEDALLQKRGAFKEMTAPEAKALSMWKVGRDELLKLTETRQTFLRQYKWLNENPNATFKEALVHFKLENKTPEGLEASGRLNLLHDYVAQNPHGDLFAIDSALEANNFVKESLSSTASNDTRGDRIVNKLMSNWMDGLFFWNPEFHGTNLFDQFISAAPMVGHSNIWAANRMLVSNIKIPITSENGTMTQVPIRKLLHDSNLAGGMKVDRAEVAAIAAGRKGKSLSETDIQSDLYNANATFIGGILKYHALMKDQLSKIGWSGSGEQFVKEILSGGKAFEKNPEIIADLYTKNAEILSRTLGVDTYRINTNTLLGQSKVAKAMMIFCKQPARVSRLGMYYLSKGDFKAFYTMLGYTALIGGRAAIPADWRFMYSMFGSPEGEKKTSAALDAIDRYKAITGEDLSPKVEMYMLWPLAAGSSPAGSMKDTIGKAIANPGKAIKGSAAGLIPMALPRVGVGPVQLPTGETIRLAKLGAQSFIDKEKKMYASTLGGFSPKDTETVPLDTAWGQWRNFLGGFIPGKDLESTNYQEDVNEEFQREHNHSLGNFMFGKSDKKHYTTK